jgi:hypothetical protein
MLVLSLWLVTVWSVSFEVLLDPALSLNFLLTFPPLLAMAALGAAGRSGLPKAAQVLSDRFLVGECRQPWIYEFDDRSEETGGPPSRRIAACMHDLSLPPTLIGEELGRGAYGQVYKGIDSATGSTVAIKQISLNGTSQDNLQSVMGEIELLKVRGGV